MDNLNKVVRFIDWMAFIVAFAVAVLPAAGYYTLSRQHLESRLDTALKGKELAVSRQINANPALWRFDGLRLAALLEADNPEYFSRILDVQRNIVVGAGAQQRPPQLVIGTLLYDAGVVVGSLEIQASLYPLYINSVLVGFAGLLVGLVVFFPLRILPRRALQSVLDELRRERNALGRLNETLEQRVAEEVEKNREKDHLMIRQSRLAGMGEMIGNIAHQWRQPLNTLSVLLANIEDSYDFGELTKQELSRQIRIGTHLVQQMSRTIDDFRNFFRPNKEKIAFSLSSTLAEIRIILGASLASHNIALEEDMPRDVVVISYANEYAQMLLNLVNNASEAIKQNDVANGRIRISVREENNMAVVCVRDNGGGIPEAVLPKIFDPYFTTKAKGTGIGLYMAKAIIETNMGGSIEVRNIGDGAELRVAVPLK